MVGFGFSDSEARPDHIPVRLKNSGAGQVEKPGVEAPLQIVFDEVLQTEMDYRCLSCDPAGTRCPVAPYLGYVCRVLRNVPGFIEIN